jgi:hypothetical protein
MAGNTVTRNTGVSSGNAKTPMFLPSHTGSYARTSGTTGTFARHAISNAVRPKRCKPWSGERVPSGKINTRKPSLTRSTPASTT